MNNEVTIRDSVKRLIEGRGWERFHKPNYLVSALSVECSELLDLCLWKDSEEINELFNSHNEEVIKELADIAINLYSIIMYSNIDIDSAVSKKVDELLERYDGLEKGEHK